MEVRNKIHPDIVEIDCPFEAAYCLYLGYQVYKCVHGTNGTKFTFLIKAFDFEILRKDFFSVDTSMFLKPFISAIKEIYTVQNTARRSSGEFISPAWRDVIQQRREKSYVG
jgi:hypothetical protein